MLLNNLYAANDVNAVVRHETYGPALYAGIMEYVKQGDNRILQRVFQLWQYDAQVGNGVAFAMPALLDFYGPRLKIIHLIRRDEKKHIDSLLKNSTTHPSGFGGYVNEDYKV